MKAVRIGRPGGPEVLEVVERSAPEPGPGDLLVRVGAAGLNRADLLQRRGLYPAPPDAPADVPGLEFAGTILRSGSRVAAGEGFRVGDRVMGIVGGGACAEQVVVPASLAMPVPSGLSLVEAAAIPEAFLTALDALETRAGLRAGESVLIHSAAGGVGTAALQIARLFGASRLFGTASGPKLEALACLGLAPDVGIDYRRESFQEVVAGETGGRGVDVILDTVGASFWAQNVESLAPLGRLVVVGLLGGRETSVDLGRLMRSRATIVGTVLRARPVWEKAELTERARRRLLPLFEAGRLRPVVDRTFPLDRAPEAHRYMEENRNVGKVVLDLERGEP